MAHNNNSYKQELKKKNETPVFLNSMLEKKKKIFYRGNLSLCFWLTSQGVRERNTKDLLYSTKIFLLCCWETCWRIAPLGLQEHFNLSSTLLRNLWWGFRRLLFFPSTKYSQRGGEISRWVVYDDTKTTIQISQSRRSFLFLSTYVLLTYILPCIWY